VTHGGFTAALALIGLSLLAEGACAGKTTTVAEPNAFGGATGTGGSAEVEGGPWPGTGGSAAGDSGAPTDAAGGTGTGGTGVGGTFAGGSGGTSSAGSGGSGGGPCVENSTKPCASSCGSGTQMCSGGEWGPCSAGQPQSCMDYSKCSVTQQCVATCPSAPAETCDLKDDNCNGTCDDGANCRVGVDRSYNGSTGEHFYTTSASEAVCCGFTLEFANYYYLYGSPVSGLAAFYRCLLGDGKHFYTTSNNCEGSAGSTVEGIMGYIATSAVCGAVPLYRLSNPNGDHLYTTSDSERQTAASSDGYTDEGVAGYVWNGP
jgi:Repeat of unknown function (DUF5648)